MSDALEVSKETSVFPLQTLPTEVLFLIFQLCDIKSVGRLACTCKRFNQVIDDDFFWQEKSKKAIITNQLCGRLRRRTYNILLPKESCRISENWQRGCYRETIHKHQSARFMPWLVLEKDSLWLSQGPCITRLMRSQRTLSTSKLFKVFHHQDVCRFVKRDDLLIIGGRDGVLSGWSASGHSQLFCYQSAHSRDVCAVDCSDTVVVSGGSDCQLKVWGRATMTASSVGCMFEGNIGDKVLCLSISPCGRLLSVGAAAVGRVAPLHLYDLHTLAKLAALPAEWKKGAGILDLAWVDDHVFLAGGYDASVGLWDTRMQEEVMEWENPFDSAVYCIQSDGANAVVSGLAHARCMQLWDKRVSNRLVQIYYARGGDSSPVYCLGFDSSALFCALDRSLHSFNFSGHSNKSKNYRACLAQSFPPDMLRTRTGAPSVQKSPYPVLRTKECSSFS